MRTQADLIDDTNIRHLGIRQAFSGYHSLCGNDGQNVTVQGRVTRLYGGAQRVTDVKKVNCPECLKRIGGES